MYVILINDQRLFSWAPCIPWILASAASMSLFAWPPDLFGVLRRWSLFLIEASLLLIGVPAVLSYSPL